MNSSMHSARPRLMGQSAHHPPRAGRLTRPHMPCAPVPVLRCVTPCTARCLGPLRLTVAAASSPGGGMGGAEEGKSELQIVKEKIEGLEDKIAALERLPIGDPERQRLAALEQQLAELQKKENILLGAATGGAAGATASAERIAAPASVQEWWRKLPRAQQEKHQLKSGLEVAFLTLVDGTRFPQLMKGRPTVNRLMRHPCYGDLHRRIHEGLTKEGTQDFLLVGTPGVGKSIFLYDLLFELACHGKTVVCDRTGAEGRAFLLTPGGVYIGDVNDFAAELESSDTWYLCDSVAPRALPVTEARAVTVVASSHRMERLNEFVKGTILELWLDTWEEEELQLCAQQVYTKIQPADVQKLFARWGGSARYVLEYAYNAVKQADWLKAARSANVSLLQVFASDIYAAPQVSHKILHVRADRSTCTKAKVVFASDAMGQAVLKQRQQQGINTLYSFITWSAGMADLSVLRGLMLQAAVFALQREGGSFDMRSAAHPHLLSFRATFPAAIRRFRRFEQVNPTLHLVENTLLMPASRTYSAVNSMMVLPLNSFAPPPSYPDARPAMAPPAPQPGRPPKQSAAKSEAGQEQELQQEQPAAVEYVTVAGVEEGEASEEEAQEVDISVPVAAAAAKAEQEADTSGQVAASPAQRKRGRPKKPVQALAPPAAYPTPFTKDIWLCQVTVSKEHPISVRGINSLLRQLPADVRVVGIAFWVPPDLFDTYGVQAFEVSKDNAIAPHIDQYVVKVPVVGLSAAQESELL